MNNVYLPWIGLKKNTLITKHYLSSSDKGKQTVDMNDKYL